MLSTQLIPLSACAVILSGCAAHVSKHSPEPAPSGVPSSATRASGALRLPESLREYRAGRYVEASDRSVMHEAHPIYRVEQSAAWNTAPDTSRTSAVVPPSSAERSTDHAAARAEFNKQRAATQAIAEQTTGLNQRLADLGKALQQAQEVAKDHLALKRQVQELRDRFDTIQTALLARPTPPSSSDNRPSEDKW